MAKPRSIEKEMRDEIVRGRISADSWLRMEDLKLRFDTGFSPIREALSRLSAEGLVELEPNKGFRVPALSRDDLADIAIMRVAIEVAALRRSIALGDHEWEVGVIAAMHRYRLKSATAFETEASLQAWEDSHDALHASLIGACASPRLLAAQKRLQDQHLRYRRMIVVPHVPVDAHVEEHERLVALVLGRKADEAVEAIERHMMITVDALDRARFWETTEPAR